MNPKPNPKPKPNPNPDPDPNPDPNQERTIFHDFESKYRGTKAVVVMRRMPRRARTPD